MFYFYTDTIAKENILKKQLFKPFSNLSEFIFNKNIIKIINMLSYISDISLI